MLCRRFACWTLVVLTVVVATSESLDAGLFRRHRGRRPCPQVCHPQKCIETVKEVQIYFMCQHQYKCNGSGNIIVGAGMHPIESTARQRAQQAAQQMAMQMCPAGYTDEGSLGCVQIQVTVARPVPTEYRQEVPEVFVQPLYECTATCYCCDGRKITARSIHTSPREACAGAKATAHAIAQGIGCSIRCCRFCVRPYCVPDRAAAK